MPRSGSRPPLGERYAVVVSPLLTIPLALATSTKTPWNDDVSVEIPPASAAAAPADPSVAIVGGTPTTSSTWPGVVALFDLNDEFACTGTLVAPDLVLSAGHCGQGIDSVHLGSSNLVNDPGEVFAVVESWVHPDFYATLDVALYRLEAEASTEPVPLLRDCLVDHLVDDAEAWIVGYGATDTYASERPLALHEAQVPIVDADCDNLGRGCNSEVSPGGELIAGGEGVDSCSGDSGGPLFLDTPDGVLLTGITSRAAVPVRVPCGDGGIYARADAVADWIETTGQVDLPTPDCDGVNRSPTVAPATLVTSELRVGFVDIVVDDPDGDQSHTLSVSEGPDVGRTWVSGQRLYYQPAAGWTGETAVVVTARDSGSPPREATGVVDIRVLAVERVEQPNGGSGSGGCRHAPGPWGWWWMALLLHPARRRHVVRAGP